MREEAAYARKTQRRADIFPGKKLVAVNHLCCQGQSKEREDREGRRGAEVIEMNITRREVERASNKYFGIVNERRRLKGGSK